MSVCRMEAKLIKVDNKTSHFTKQAIDHNQIAKYYSQIYCIDKQMQLTCEVIATQVIKYLQL